MSVLSAMQTQLRRSGMSGKVYGLDYSVLPWVMSQVGVPDERVTEVFAQVRIAESELLLMLGGGV